MGQLTGEFALMTAGACAPGFAAEARLDHHPKSCRERRHDRLIAFPGYLTTPDFKSSDPSRAPIGSRAPTRSNPRILQK
jgi:hypothetical protein